MNQQTVNVVELFKSIEGEGIRAGFPTTFVRFAGCNLKCSYCDTAYAQENCSGRSMEWTHLMQQIFLAGCERVTFTGGEPLLNGRAFIKYFLKHCPYKFDVNIETNGAVDIKNFVTNPNAMITMDYKCPSSGMMDTMLCSNLSALRETDVLKFVVGTKEDLDEVEDILLTYNVHCRNIYINPVFGQLPLQTIADFVINCRLRGVRMGLQMHKIIWDPDQRGV